MLRAAFNVLTRLQSSPGQLRRLGSPDIYSPCRLTPSNFFRFIKGPDTTVIHGREFVVPIDTISGQFAESISFSKVPTAGHFKLSYNSNLTGDLAFNISSSDLQTALRLLSGLGNVLVTGDTTVGFLVVFSGFHSAPLALISSDSSTLLGTSSVAITIAIANTFQAWPSKPKRSDKIIHAEFGQLTITEVVEMPDIGGSTMGYRINCE